MSSHAIRKATVLFCIIAFLPVLARAADSAPPQWSTTAIGLDDPKLQSAVRQVVDLDARWKFLRDDAAGAEQPNFDDSAWQTVSLPHTWNALDGEDGGNNYHRGPAWYRTHIRFTPDGSNGVPAVVGKSVFLRFDAASSVADVYVNGKQAGEHKGMFAAFCFDVTRLIDPQGDNVIAVRVDNTNRPDVPPLTADFTFFGGLYRRAHLLILNPVSISPVVDASPGVFVKQTKVANASADAEATVCLRNAGPAPVQRTVTVEVRDASGARAAFAQRDVTVSDATSITLPIHVENPHLWNGRKDPYLYTVRVSLLDGTRVEDIVDQPLGFRYFRCDPDQGFFLNGQPYPLHGVNRHQDRIDMGWAITPVQQSEDFSLIMEMGCTGIRLAHYQHAQEFYDLCDHGGLLVWAEACMVNGVTPSQAFDDTALEQVRELIHQNFNHPSICFWSIYNELGNSDHGSAAQRAQQRKDQVAIVKQLNDLAHQLDDSRPTTAASDHAQVSNDLNKITDVLGVNAYHGWYGGKPTDWPTALDTLHKNYPQKPLAISEYGAGASIHDHEANPPQPKTTSHWHPEEWQCIVHEDAWDAMRQRPWLWGTFLWCMFDFASDGRHEGDHDGINDKGLVSYNRKVKKDAFYFYKANWSDDPFVYITDRRFTPRPSGEGPAKIYSNCDEVVLSVNGVSLGIQEGDADHIFRWPDLKLKQGENQITAAGTRDGKTYQDACTIVVDPNTPEPSAEAEKATAR